MADLTPDDMAAKLLASGFQRQSPAAQALSDPIADTPMVGHARRAEALRTRPAADAQPAL